MAQQSAPTAKKQHEAAPRPPVVVVLGHVDHGKSSLLEAVRKEFRITSRESGGITQHIGAYEAEIEGKKITFLDTPGHEAFSAMRSRGARVADIALLVVAADDGVKLQTKEALSHIQAAGLPYIVVATKLDKPEASPDKVKQQLAQEGVLVEGFGGSVPFAQVSATTQQGIPELLELILLVAEMERIGGDSAAPLAGVVIESGIDEKRGPAATVLVRQGRLAQGDSISTPTTAGKARILEDFEGGRLSEAGPSQPVLVVGWEKVPQVGEGVVRGPQAQEIQASQAAVREEGGDLPGIQLVLKADVAGSLEAVESELKKLPQEASRLVFVHTGVGDIGEADIKLAAGSRARVLGFRVKARAGMADLAERSGVSIASFDIIYKLIEHVQELLERYEEQAAELKEKGVAEILAVFSKKRNEQVVGGRVLEGEVRKGMKAEIFRGEELVGGGRVKNLQRNKEDVAAVPATEEFGMLLESPVSLQAQDKIKVY